jgi:hypothetical protein
MYRQRAVSKKILACLPLPAACAMALVLATAPTVSAQCDPPPSGTMVAWYPFDEAASPSINLATQNSGVWSVPGPTPVAGEVAGALSFNGANNYIDTPDSIVTNFGPAGAATCGGGDYSTCPGNFSIDTWVKIPSVNIVDEVETIVDKRDANYIGYDLFLYKYSAGKYVQIGVQLGDSSGFANYSSVPLKAFTANAWHHIAATVNRLGKITYYLDGVNKGTLSVTGQTGSLVNNVPLRIGDNTAASGSGSFFLGELDELEIFNRVLTGPEVKAIYTAQTSGKCKP